jgi:hypothetical protein
MMRPLACCSVSLVALATACSDAANSPWTMQPTNDAQSPDAAASGGDSGSLGDVAAADTWTSSTSDAPVGPMPDAASDAASDDGPSMDAAPEAATPTCGPPPARYTLLTGADAGLVRDNVTMLVWMSNDHGAGEPPQTQSAAATYCMGIGMRLPTKDEAVALAANYAACAFGHWGTWTSTAAPAAGDAWVVDYAGEVSPQLADNFPSGVLCVRDPSGG